jgi:four helix bundle protein
MDERTPFRFQDLEIWKLARDLANQEFRHYLNIARRSTFENASMILVFHSRGLISSDREDALLSGLDALSRRITAFRNTLE